MYTIKIEIFLLTLWALETMSSFPLENSANYEYDLINNELTLAPDTYDLNKGKLEWTPGGRYYPTVSKTMILTVDSGYTISVTINKCDLDGTAGDFFYVKAENNSKEGKTVTYTLDRSRKYIFHSDKVTAQLTVSGKENLINKGITVTFERTDEIYTTTTTVETTTPIRPTTSRPTDTRITVEVFGAAPRDYDNKLINCFKDSLVNMATNYTTQSGITPENSITKSNIVLELLTACPIVWPDHDQCVQVNFRIPILVKDPAKWGYQLTSQNLQEMWDDFADSFLDTCGLSVYSEPSTGIFKWWIIVVVLVAVIFLIILVVARKWGRTILLKSVMKRRESDVAIIPNQSNNTAGMEPHYMQVNQVTPEFFENIYSEYKPGQETYEAFGQSEKNYSKLNPQFIHPNDNTANEGEINESFQAD